MFLTYRSTSVYYFRTGKGKSLLLLHGWGAESGIFNPIINHYKNNFEVIAVDFPPFGLSGELPFDYTIYDYTELIKALLKSLNINDIYILCHSFGGRVAAALAAQEDNPVKKIIFCASAGILPKNSLFKMIKKARYNIYKFLYSIKMIPQKKLIECFSADYRNLPQNMRKTFVNIIKEDLTPCIKKIKCPCQIIWGKKDRETPIYMAKRINKLIRGSKLSVIEGGHYCFLDDFKNFTAIADKFLYEEN